MPDAVRNLIKLDTSANPVLAKKERCDSPDSDSATERKSLSWPPLSNSIHNKKYKFAPRQGSGVFKKPASSSNRGHNINRQACSPNFFEILIIIIITM